MRKNVKPQDDVLANLLNELAVGDSGLETRVLANKYGVIGVRRGMCELS